MARNILGTGARHRTDLRVSGLIRGVAEEYADALGVPLNVIFTMGVAHLAVTMGPLVARGGKRRKMVADMEREFLRLCKEMREAS